MSDPRDEISRIIQLAELAAYQRGWDDACAEIAQIARTKVHALTEKSTVADAGPMKEPRRTGRPSSKAIKVVEECIVATPGMKGVDVVKAAQAIDAAIKERTVRTCLRRLRLSKTIWKRSGLWYPTKEKTLFESANGEAVGSPPH